MTESQTNDHESNTLQLLYAIEHQLFANEFFNHTDQFINLISDENGVYDLFETVFAQNHLTDPYGPNDFHVDFFRDDTGSNLISVELPTPQCAPLCYKIYLFTDSDFENKRLFTIEKEEDEPGLATLCEWSEFGHAFHDIVPQAD